MKIRFGMTNSQLTHELILHLIRTRRAFRQTVQRSLRQHNIDMTFEMLQVMHRLWQEQGISQQRLAELTSKNKASLTNLINNLIKKGWVCRREDDLDRRNRLIFLTPTGEALANVVRPPLDDIYQKAGQKMDTRRIKQCMDCLDRLHDVLSHI